MYSHTGEVFVRLFKVSAKSVQTKKDCPGVSSLNLRNPIPFPSEVFDCDCSKMISTCNRLRCTALAARLACRWWQICERPHQCLNSYFGCEPVIVDLRKMFSKPHWDKNTISLGATWPRLLRASRLKGRITSAGRCLWYCTHSQMTKADRQPL